MNPLDSQKIKIFRSIFMGRDDAYGLESSPSPITVREALTDSLIYDHLKGIKRIGVFLIGKDNRVKAAVVDLDRDDRGELQRIVAVLIDNGFYPYVERSKAKGYHIWIFFDEPIEAAIVRKVLLRILKDAEIENIEIFPKQDLLNPTDGLGNYVFLPLHGKSVQDGRTIFLNAQFQPYENQWDHLSKIHRTKTENILNLTEEEMQDHRKPQMDSIPEGSLDVPKYLIGHNIPFKGKKETTRTIYTLFKCLFSENHTTPNGQADSSIIQGNDGKLGYFCFHNHCQNKTWADARKKISGDEPLTKFLKGYTEHKAGVELKLTTIAEIFKYPDLTYLIENMIVEESVDAIGGYTGTGKSIVVLELIKSISTGKPFLGKYPVNKKGPVLLVDEETPRPLLRDRIKKMKFDSSWPVYFLHFQDIKIDKESVFNALMEKIKEVKPVLVVFDSLIRIHRKREKESEEMAQVIDALRKIANWGTTVLIIHHHKKGGGPLTEKLRGSSDIPGGIDVEFALIPEKEGNDILLFQSVKTRIKPFPPIRLKLNITEDSATVEYYGTQNETILEVIVGVLSGVDDFLTVKDITQKLIDKNFDGFKEYEIRKALKEGERVGTLISNETKIGKSKAITYKVR